MISCLRTANSIQYIQTYWINLKQPKFDFYGVKILHLASKATKKKRKKKKCKKRKTNRSLDSILDKIKCLREKQAELATVNVIYVLGRLICTKVSSIIFCSTYPTLRPEYIPGDLGHKVRINPFQDKTTQLFTHYGHFRDTNRPIMQVFGLEEETGEPGGAGMETGLEPQTWRWKSTNHCYFPCWRICVCVCVFVYFQ